jgi:hypothetical protein
MEEQIPWHRLFGMSWMDFFRGLPVSVEMEKDLSLKVQLLDLVIIRKDAAVLPRRLPDGFEDLGPHNLLSFKSLQEPLDGWVLLELLGHYVNYRKQVSPSMQRLLPESDFRLFAVTVRFPQKLEQQVEMTRVQAGVYEVRYYTGKLRVIVVHQLPLAEHNAMLHLFGAQDELVSYGKRHYQVRSEETSTVLLRLFARYRQENTIMPDLLEQLTRETIDELLRKLPPDDLLKQLTRETIDELLRKLPPEELRKRLSPQQRLQGLSDDDLLAALPPERRAALLRRLKDNGSSATPG